MQVKFKKYGPNNKPDIGDLCLCECNGYCEEGAIVAKFTSNGFYFSGQGAIVDKYITGFIVLDI